jgi:hypothetical protein
MIRYGKLRIYTSEKDKIYPIDIKQIEIEDGTDAILIITK